MQALPSRVVIASKNPVKINAVREAFRRALPHLQLEFSGVSSDSGVGDQPYGDAETLRGAFNRIAFLRQRHPAELIVALEGGVGPALTLDHPLTAAAAAAAGASSNPALTLQENAPPNAQPPSPPQQQQASPRKQEQQQQQAPGSPGAYAGPGTGSQPSPGSAGIGSSSGGSSSGPPLECFAWAVLQTPEGGLSQARSASFALPPRVSELVHGGMELGAADDAVFGRVNSGQGSGTIGKLTHGVVTRTEYYEHACIMALVPLLNPDLFPGFEG